MSVPEETDIFCIVEDTHAGADVRELSVKPLLYIIEEIFQPATPSVLGSGQGTQVQLNVLDDNAFQFDLNAMLDLLSSTINEISSKLSSGGDEHETTMGILKNLGSYNWDAKAVLPLVAFAFNFGDFLAKAQPDSSNPFKQVFVDLSDLIKVTLNMTKCIVEFTEVESHNTISIYGVGIPNKLYWTIRCIVGCASQILGLTGMGCGKVSTSIAEAKFAYKVSKVHSDLEEQLNELKETIRSNEASQTLERLMKKVYTDNIEVMTELIYAKEDQLPLLEGDTETRASIQVLKSKIVLLLISDMYITDEELFILKKMYRESHNDPTSVGSQYEMVWIPVVDRSNPWTHAKQDQFETNQLRMPWYSVYHPLMIDIAVIMYIQEVWQFKKNPIIVVFDPQGQVINSNALPMIRIWGGPAFPFTSSKETELWAGATSTFEFLAGSIDAAIPIWRAEDNYMCLYGGENVDWIKNFTTRAQTVAEAIRIKLQILYVGKSSPGEQIRENMSTITVKKLSNSLQDLTLVRVFWERLKSMKQSRMQLKCAVQNDPVLQEINTILSFDEKDEGWALFCKGSDMAMAKSKIILQCLTNFRLWRKYMNYQDFVIALNHYNRRFSIAQLMESQHLDNINVLRALIYAKEDQLPLLEGDTKTMVSIEVLKSKTVLLLISNAADKELPFMPKKMNEESRQFEMVWIPVVDRSTPWTEAEENQFVIHQWCTPWYSVCHHSIIDLAAIMYIVEVWNFKRKPIVVIQDENYICLYGGENIDWIREFTATARKVAEAASIPLQILYAGKSNSNEEQVRKIIDTINVEKLSHSLQQYHQVWFFWQRLESMWHSKTQLGCTVENDPILQEINTLLSFDENHEGWAVFCKGTAMAKAKGETILQCIKDFDSWKTLMEDKDFMTALNHHLNQLQKLTSTGEREHN
ncbi:hypothetical protein Patl1_33335 [Pistacia atlantica]|uniref:Uncharacterized protein n=1 Tax=Pistacia atlantica TaxID=434234 RepID=A0ACC0ZS20_9ROSI|nr:hypothetical protein Patl1_33335 [Pistacia atlantica]